MWNKVCELSCHSSWKFIARIFGKIEYCWLFLFFVLDLNHCIILLYAVKATMQSDAAATERCIFWLESLSYLISQRQRLMRQGTTNLVSYLSCRNFEATNRKYATFKQLFKWIYCEMPNLNKLFAFQLSSKRLSKRDWDVKLSNSVHALRFEQTFSARKLIAIKLFSEGFHQTFSIKMLLKWLRSVRQV